MWRTPAGKSKATSPGPSETPLKSNEGVNADGQASRKLRSKAVKFDASLEKGLKEKTNKKMKGGKSVGVRVHDPQSHLPSRSLKKLSDNDLLAYLDEAASDDENASLEK